MNSPITIQYQILVVYNLTEISFQGCSANLTSYLLANDNPIEDGETVDGIVDGAMSREVQWRCQYEEALVQPPREVLDVCMGDYAAGNRNK